jgi:hypothetical protein
MFWLKLAQYFGIPFITNAHERVDLHRLGESDLQALWDHELTVAHLEFMNLFPFSHAESSLRNHVVPHAVVFYSHKLIDYRLNLHQVLTV